jgi:hypothetical protein
MFGALQRDSLAKPSKPEREDHFAQFEQELDAGRLGRGIPNPHPGFRRISAVWRS